MRRGTQASERKSVRDATQSVLLGGLPTPSSQPYYLRFEVVVFSVIQYMCVAVATDENQAPTMSTLYTLLLT